MGLQLLLSGLYSGLSGNTAAIKDGLAVSETAKVATSNNN
jgi:F0F1-type ATP synthase membrane subunit c/vacuolar-type H+-ATPase subunit K